MISSNAPANVAQNWTTSRIPPKSGRFETLRAQIRPTVAGVGQTWFGICQQLRNSAKFGPPTANFGQRWPHVDQHLPGIGQTWCGIGQIWPELRQFWADIGQCRHTLARSRPTFVGNRPTLVRNRPNVGRSSAKVSPTSAKVGQLWPEVDQSWPESEHLCGRAARVRSHFGSSAPRESRLARSATMAGASAVFIMDMKGKVIISRNYRGEVPMNITERFQQNVIDAEDTRVPMGVMKGEPLCRRWV